jgi:hypothetical protein
VGTRDDTRTSGEAAAEGWGRAATRRDATHDTTGLNLLFGSTAALQLHRLILHLGGAAAKEMV